MSEYNDLLDFSAYELTSDALGTEYPAPSSDLGQLGAWSAPLQPPSSLTEGDTAAQLQTHVDFAPFAVADSSGFEFSHHSQGYNPSKHACVACLVSFQTASALDNHAKASQHHAYKCKCGTDFKNKSALNRHIKDKDAPKTFACTLCSDKFVRKDKLHDHCRHYHKVTDDGLRALFRSQDPRTRAGASRRRRAPVSLAAASSESAPAPAPAPAPTPAPAGPSVWSPAAYTGQQYATFPAGPSVPAAHPFPAPSVSGGEIFAGTAIEIFEIFGDGLWDLDFNSF
ncbi:hypothetical protein Daus18300_010131 [Diaporthe australafricana]|uniref:C2H2-type domain-containing protein n=1 Tax=Diaporthe australafricana TaxID=127596 RepID=A0ABR3WBC9_9PEZI